MSRKAVRVRSSALLFYLQIPQKRRTPDVRFGVFVSSRLYANASSMLLAACLPMEAYPVREAIKNHGYAGVPQKMLNQFRVNVAPCKQGGARVLEVVPANIAKP
jgi:hypothetical protein